MSGPVTGTIATWISRLRGFEKKPAKAVGPPTYFYQKCTTLKVVEFAHILIILAFGGSIKSWWNIMRVCRLLSHFGGFLKWRLPPNPPNKSTILSTFQPMVFHQKWYSYLQIPLFTIICIIDIAHILEISSYFPMKSRFMKLMSSFSPPFSHIFAVFSHVFSR